MNNKWESSPFGPPSAPGVYCVSVFNLQTKKSQILYIGSSQNISKRVLNTKHPYRVVYDQMRGQFDMAVTIRFKECDDFIELEKKLIRRLRPPLNLQHSGKEYRSYQIRL